MDSVRSAVWKSVWFANVVVDKFLGINKPVWVISLDLSKAFDGVEWDNL